jgi:protocatechuate 3,4-dioxygenase alpha subunit
VIFPSTPSQTVGPYFAIGMSWEEGAHVVAPAMPGAIKLTGSVLDGAGAPVADHVIEIWQADPSGQFADLYGHSGRPINTGFRGFGRAAQEDGDGTFELWTLKPGPVPGARNEPQAPHIDVSLFARGLLHRLVTRIYFADEPELNACDPVLMRVSADRRDTLLAKPTSDGYRFDIRIQGERETVFFAI